QRRQDGEEKGGSKEYGARDPDQFDGFYLQQKHEEYGADLRERVRFAKDAGTKIAQAGNGKQNSAGSQNGNIAAENQDGIFPGNFVQNGQHKEQCAEEKLVRDGVEILAEQSLLMQPAGEEAVETIAEAGDHK